jgi:hypothetical protein
MSLKISKTEIESNAFHQKIGNKKNRNADLADQAD